MSNHWQLVVEHLRQAVAFRVFERHDAVPGLVVVVDGLIKSSNQGCLRLDVLSLPECNLLELVDFFLLFFDPFLQFAFPLCQQINAVQVIEGQH